MNFGDRPLFASLLAACVGIAPLACTDDGSGTTDATMDAATTNQHAANLLQLSHKARSVVRDLDPQNDLTFLRVRTKKHELMIAPEKEFMLVVVQNPNTEQ